MRVLQWLDIIIIRRHITSWALVVIGLIYYIYKGQSENLTGGCPIVSTGTDKVSYRVKQCGFVHFQ